MTTKKAKAQTLRHILCLILILVILTLTLVKEISRSSDVYSFEVTTLATYTQADTLTGYVFRDEIALDSVNNGPVHYLTAEGETVSAGTLLAEVYRDDTGADKREHAAALYAEIAALQAALAAEAEWKTAYLADYPALMQSITNGCLADAAVQATALGATLGGGECAKAQTADELRTRIDAAEAQLAEMVRHTNDPDPVVATADGVFYHTADGYEKSFDTQAAASLTPQGLTALLKTPANSQKGVGKLVSTDKWFLAVPVQKALADTYTAQADYILHFEGGVLSMTLERISLAEDGAQALLLFAADALPSFLSCSRAQRISVEKQTVTGLSVPACALAEESAVYVIRDGTARLCPVTVLQADRNGTLLLAEQQEGALHEGDRVIVSARQLFDGKVLK